jgi:hypothetical protein
MIKKSLFPSGIFFLVSSISDLIFTGHIELLKNVISGMLFFMSMIIAYFINDKRKKQ